MIDLSKEIEKIASEYVNDCDKILEKVKITVSKKGLKKIKDLSPVRKGNYKKEWKISEKENTIGGSTMVIHSGKNAYLTHLLEYGHMTRNGKSRTKAIEHIKPTEKFIKEEIERELKEQL